MPTTRKRQSRHRHDPALSVELTDLLLLGRARSKREIAAWRQAGGEYDEFVEFDFRLPGTLAALWHQHREWLLGEFRRRGLKGKPWGAKFDRAL